MLVQRAPETWPWGSQAGLPATGLQSPSPESMEVVAVKDFTDDN